MRLSYLKLTFKSIVCGGIAVASGAMVLFWIIGLMAITSPNVEDPVAHAVTCLVLALISALVFWPSARGIRAVSRCVQFYRILSDDYVRSVRHLADILDRPVERVGRELSTMISHKYLIGIHLDRRLDRILFLGDKKTYHL